MKFFLCHVVSCLTRPRPPYSGVQRTTNRQKELSGRGQEMEEVAVAESAEKTAVDYEEMVAEYTACQQQLQSKEQALRILQGQLKKADLTAQRLKQEMKQLRSQLSRSQQISSPVSPTGAGRVVDSSSVSFSINEDLIREKEQLIQELEQAHWRIGNLERHVEQLKDEKENLVDEKLHYVTKYESLLKCFEEEKKRQPPSMSTVQRVLDENKELQLALVEANAGKDHFKARVQKIRDAMERKKSIESAGELAASPDKKLDFKTARRIAELESLAKNLTESVKIKSVTISHQKRANKMLATDLAQLQHRMNMWEASCSCGKVSARNSLHSHTPTLGHQDTGTRGKSTSGEGASLDLEESVTLDAKSNRGVAPEGGSAVNGGVAPEGGSAVNGGVALDGVPTTECMCPDKKLSTGGVSPDRKSCTGGVSPDRKSCTGGVSPDRKSSTGVRAPDKAVLCDETCPTQSVDQDGKPISNGSLKT